mmetsp:Transcript_5118/g.13875  ORF Transcript_5118/g.13875 Transcript_5118/m.13875 type:complete len:202 (-) Transcript_5118:351-956(-)
MAVKVILHSPASVTINTLMKVTISHFMQLTDQPDFIQGSRGTVVMGSASGLMSCTTKKSTEICKVAMNRLTTPVNSAEMSWRPVLACPIAATRFRAHMFSGRLTSFGATISGLLGDVHALDKESSCGTVAGDSPSSRSLSSPALNSSFVMIPSLSVSKVSKVACSCLLSSAAASDSSSSSGKNAGCTTKTTKATRRIAAPQ